jgi:putative transposase
MGRPTRFFVPGISVHLIQRGNNRSKAFDDESDYELFLLMLRGAATRYGLAVHGFVLMTTHFHLLATPLFDFSVSRAMQKLDGQYARWYNRRHDRIGPLWNGRFRGIEIANEKYWLTCLRYIEVNPVRAGIVESPELYRWSSYAAHGGNHASDWLSDHPVYTALGKTAKERQTAYRDLCNCSLTAEESARVRYGYLAAVPDRCQSRLQDGLQDVSEL